jgi:hypothetical protein
MKAILSTDRLYTLANVLVAAIILDAMAYSLMSL